MTVYHGSSVVVERPDVLHSYRPLDFGKGFYVTTVAEQAERWARRKKDLLGSARAVVNRYDMSTQYEGLKYKGFEDNLSEWIDFICLCRAGGSEYQRYDLIYGKVADDKVFRVVDLYRAGIWDKERALTEIRAYPDYDQYAFITQMAIDKLLVFRSSYEV